MCRTEAYDIWNMDTNLWDDIEKMFQVEVGAGVGVGERVTLTFFTVSACNRAPRDPGLSFCIVELRVG